MIYYYQRKKYNLLSPEEKKTPLGSALFIFLNKMCFRGMFRVSKNGFNVPYGNYKNPKIIDITHLNEISTLIQDVVFECRDFRDSFSSVEDGDFVYLDPPYAPESSTSFVAYTESGFDKETHLALFQLVNTSCAKILMSNADTEFVRENICDNIRENIVSFECRRAINAKKPDAKVMEVLIKNY